MKTAEELFNSWCAPDGVMTMPAFKKALTEDRQQRVDKIKEMIEELEKRKEITIIKQVYVFYATKIEALTELLKELEKEK